MEVSGGLLEDECGNLISHFFQQKRAELKEEH